jgi:predicted XRE-type DNA-binding protein
MEMIEFEESTGNVYADIGQKDAAEMLVKAQLATKIGEIIKTRKWTQQEASDVLGLTQPKLSKMLRGQFRGISEAKMLDCLARLGRDVQIVVGPARRSVAVGRVAVVFAARSPQHRRSPQGL